MMMGISTRLPSKPYKDMSGKTEEGILVPVAQDGSFFHSGLRGPSGYRIGKKGEERVASSFEDALAALRKMSDPYWRRPSRTSGTPGIVKGVRWEMRPTRAVYSEADE